MFLKKILLPFNRASNRAGARKCIPLFALLSCILVCIHTTIHACTTFFIHHRDQMVFGRNYDWLADAGMVCTNQRGLEKTSFKNADGKTISWISKYGSISFNQYGKEMPTGGMNEKGLVVELMWLDETKYPKPDDRPSIGVLQWIQYQLDNCATIDEVIATDRQLRITSGGTPLHYLVADANGHAATIEFLDGKMKVHKDDQLPFPVLTNDTYERSVKSKTGKISTLDNSLARFSTACSMVEQYKGGSQSLVDYSFNILDQVSQGDFTKWSIVYDITNKAIYFKTEAFNQVRSLRFSFFDFECKKPSRMLTINSPDKGDISHLLTDFSASVNRSIFEKTVEQSRPRIVLDKAKQEAVLAYPGTIHCQ